MNIPIRNSAKVILLNEKNELLLMCADDPKTTTVDGKYHGKFWFLIGGEIEKNESLQEAAIREIHEETGIEEENIELGPFVWFGEYKLKLNGVITLLKQKFMVATTSKTDVYLNNLTNWEKSVLQELRWFSLDDIISCNEVVYPVLLPKYLPDILSGKHPNKPIEIDLSVQP